MPDIGTTVTRINYETNIKEEFVFGYFIQFPPVLKLTSYFKYIKNNQGIWVLDLFWCWDGNPTTIKVSSDIIEEAKNKLIKEIRNCEFNNN